MTQDCTFTTHFIKASRKGELANLYTPLQNLIDKNYQLGEMTTENLHFDKFTPVEMLVVDEYDGSTNLIINDDKNAPKLINSGFAVQENNTFNIPEHSGNSVTNIYEDATFHGDTLLIKLYNTIPTLNFKGIQDGGSLPCGSYTFYFKYTDFDGNLTNIVQESGIVQVHVGEKNSPKIRMGMQDENANKSVEFELTKIDSGFDYIKVFYERTSTDNSQAKITRYYMIDELFPIENGTCKIVITGSENTLEIQKADIQNLFADIQTAKTQAIVDNILFLGNVSSYKHDYPLLQLIAWKIKVSAHTSSKEYKLRTSDYAFTDESYYNMKNVYDSVGYWPDELYRLGIVFIYDNNLLSPVFNLQGIDLATVENDYSVFDLGNKWVNEPSDGWFDKKLRKNSKGVFHLPNKNIFRVQNGIMYYTPMYLSFNFKDIIYKKYYEDSHVYEDIFTTSDTITSLNLLHKLGIKGFFFVRQKRIPSIIAQGMVIGLTGRYNGAIPVLKQGSTYVTKSFLTGHMLRELGSTITVGSSVTNQALLLPDYELDEASLNSVFCGLNFLLNVIGNAETNWYDDSCNVTGFNSTSRTINDVTLTAIPKDTKTRTDGESYFSALAGNPDEPYKTSDVTFRWNKTAPQKLTLSQSLIRGRWGSYVGIGSGQNLNYGDIVNIKLGNWKNADTIDLEFEKRFNDFNFYSPISTRYNTSDISSALFNCYRGDCFVNLFTHRMMSNFIDPELPTNTSVIDPSCWIKNYVVRCTAEILSTTHSNLTDDSDGFYIPRKQKNSSIVSIIMGLLLGNPEMVINAITDLATLPASQSEYANEVTQAFEIKATDIELEDSDTSMDMELFLSKGWVKKVAALEQEASGGINLKALFKSDDGWELHGLSLINRADVNAVSYGLWITFPVCSRFNMAMRDVDFNQATEEAKFNKKRSFFPLEAKNPEDKLFESGIINAAAATSLSSNSVNAYKTVPYIKQEFFNRIYWSKPNVSQKFINSYRLIYSNQFKEYNKEYGAITKILQLGNSLLVVFLHGIGILPVDKSIKTPEDASPFLSSKNVLPSAISVLTPDYGSMWKDSVIKTTRGYVYGVDTVAKKIWRTNGQGLEFISDFKILKFLNDNINLSEYDFTEYLGHINVKAHYNEFKHDVIFTFYKDTPLDENGEKIDLSGNLVLEDTEDNSILIKSWEEGKTWSVCYNEITQQWVTFYDWYPLLSCNVDNIFFSFNKEEVDDVIADDTEDSGLLNLNNFRLDTEDIIDSECLVLLKNEGSYSIETFKKIK